MPLQLQTPFATNSRTGQEQRALRDFSVQEERGKQPNSRNIDYPSYTQKVVGQLSSLGFDNDAQRRLGLGTHSQQALSAYTEQQQSLDRENLDAVRNLLGVDYYV
ncbi:MAG: hypothetical protein EPN21_12020 [Methylococcaceae bacterium]|nr:MAG: hypothetical protein EPN21_12020 [Methylococcaceae bacterium]